MDADIVSLEEIENSVALGEATATTRSTALVAALNADAGITHAGGSHPSRRRASCPPAADQDVIRTAFIFNPDTVTRVGASKVLARSRRRSPTRGSRWRKRSCSPVGAEDTATDAFAVIVNHFKSKRGFRGLCAVK